MKIVADNNFSCDSMILCAAVPTIHYLDVNRYRGQYEVILKLVLLLLWNNCHLDFRHHCFPALIPWRVGEGIWRLVKSTFIIQSLKNYDRS